MTNLKWTIGDIEICQIVELGELEAGPLIQSVIRSATPEKIQEIGWLHPHFADDAGNLKALVQSFLIRSGNKNILIDTCNGNDKVRTDAPEWGTLQTEFLQQLREIGVTPNDVNVVACTHLHMDHVGWNTRLENGTWVPTFPHAEYLFAKQEYEYWIQKPEQELSDFKAAIDDSVTPIVQAGLARLVDVNYRIDKHIRFIPSPGHTPCHASVLVESQNERALISGDILHHPCQVAHPTWTTDADTLPERAVETRQKILGDIADTSTLLIGSHFANPVAARVVRVNGQLSLRV